MNQPPSDQTQRVLDRLKGVKRNSNGWTARCPGHDDRRNSLSIGTGENERVLIKCFAGCELSAIIQALGLDHADLFPPTAGGGGVVIPFDNRATEQPHLGCTLAEYSETKQLPVEFLESLGVRDFHYFGKPAVRIPYLDADGADVAVRFRINLTGARFRWRRRDKPCLYGLWRLKDAGDDIALVEGESDCHTLWHHGIPAVGLPGAANWKETRDADCLARFKTIYVVTEPDDGGEAVKAWLSTSAIRDRVRLVDLGEHKDVSGLHLADPEEFKMRWQDACSNATPWHIIATEKMEAARSEAWGDCRDLAREPEILRCFVDDTRRCGVVGEDRAVQLLYLALTSRLLDKPVSVAVKGPSAAGKNFIAQAVLEYFPPDAYHALTAMSERALAYSDEPLRHRFLVLYEAVGLGTGLASYLIRSLLSEGRLRYEVVEKTKDGLRPRLIEREGPTGLLITTTAIHLHNENETRLLSIGVTDSADQTKQILASQANESKEQVDVRRWHALQTWLAGGKQRVVIPYAPALARAIPAVAVRLRRDFPAVLALIRANALLHQAKRDRDGSGRIIASMEDYAVVRGLVADIVAEGVEATVRPEVRETVETVGLLHRDAPDGVTLKEVGARLKLDKGPTSRRVRDALGACYVKNLEEKLGRPLRLVPADPVPEDLEILPTPERLEQVLRGCAVDGGVHTLSPLDDRPE